MLVPLYQSAWCHIPEEIRLYNIQYFLFGFKSNTLYLTLLTFIAPIQVAVRSKAWVCGRLLTRIVGSNPAEGMDVCLL
jgi:hypothetical protein